MEFKKLRQLIQKEKEAVNEAFAIICAVMDNDCLNPQSRTLPPRPE